MPMYDYSCRACDHHFEMLVRASTVPVCPECRSEDVERLLSLPSVRSESTRQQALRSAKQRDARQANERVHAQRQYELHHDD
jgi:putative FmdB family regulatory protein